MTARSRSELKEFFETGDRPTEDQFADLIDSYTLYSEKLEALAALLENADQTNALLGIDNSGLPTVHSIGTAGRLLIANEDISGVLNTLGLGTLGDFGRLVLATEEFEQAANLLDLTPSASVNFKNRIINGDFRVWQSGTAIASPSHAARLADRFQLRWSGSAVVTVEQVDGSVSGRKAMRFTVTTGDASIGASDLYKFRYRGIEAYDFGDAAWGTSSAKTVTLTFRVRSSVTGTYGVLIANDTGTRRYIATYTISQANTWETKEIQIPGDTTGSWGSDVGRALFIDWTLAGGSNSHGTANAWFATSSGSTVSTVSGQANAMSSASNTFWIEQIQLEIGDRATPYAPRPIGTEFALCQRYLPVIKAESVNDYIGGAGIAGNTTSIRVVLPFQVRPRVPPTGIEISSAAHFSLIQSSTTTQCISVQFSVGMLHGAMCNFGVGSGLTAGTPYLVFANNASAYIRFDGCDFD